MSTKVDIEALRQKELAKLEKTIKIAERHNEILEAWDPVVPAPTKISEHSAYSHAFVEIECEDIDAAASICNKMHTLPLFRLHDGWLSFRPWAHVPGEWRRRFEEGENNGKHGTIWAIDPMIYKVEQTVAGHKIEDTAIWFAIVSNYLIEVRAKLDKPASERAVRAYRPGPHLEIEYTRHCVDTSGRFTNSNKFYNTDKQALGTFIFWSHCEEENA